MKFHAGTLSVPDVRSNLISARRVFLALYTVLLLAAPAGSTYAANVQANVDGGGPETRKQSETTLVEFDYDDPSDSPDLGPQDVILVGYNDFNPFTNCFGGFCFPWTGISRSVAGAPFAHTTLPGGGVVAAPTGTLARGDGVLAVDYHAGLDGLGNPLVYALHMASPLPPVGSLIIQMYVSSSSDGGRTFPASSAMRVSTPAGGASDDKPWIAVDQRGGPRGPDGNVYVCWTRTTLTSSGALATSQILLSQIPPGGPPGPEVPITPVRSAPQFVQSCQVAVDSSGHVYVAWTEFGAAPTNTPSLMLRHAPPPAGADAAVFDSAVQVEQLRGGNFGVPGGIVNCAAPNWLPQGLRGPFLYDFVMNASSLATNPLNGDIYLAWSMWNGPASTNGPPRFDVFLKSGSRPGGTMDWDRKEVVNKDGATATDQFMPSVATYPLPVQPVPLLVTPTVAVSWSDKRNSGLSNNGFEIFGARSPFSSDGVLSDAGVEAMNPAAVNLNCRIGDYNALTSAQIESGTPDGSGPGTYFLHAWGDTRNSASTDPEVFFASEEFTPDSLIHLPPLLVDIGLSQFSPKIPLFELPVGDPPFHVPVDVFLFSGGQEPVTIDTWFGVSALPDLRVSWVGGASQTDACFGPSPPDRAGPAIPIIGVPCDKGPILALGTEMSIGAGGQVGLQRELEVSCLAEGTFKIGLFGGTGPVLPLEVQDPNPGNNGLEATIEVTCLADPRPPAPENVVWDTLSTLKWDAVPVADSYYVYRGELLSAPQLDREATDSCLRLKTTSPDTILSPLAETPAAGSYLWFLVNSVDASGRESATPQRVLDSAGDCALCPHDKCVEGSLLDPTCDACVDSICAADPFCCDTAWDSLCVEEVLSVCGSMLCPGSGGACAHTLCRVSGPLGAGCDDPPVTPSCVGAVCALDPFCCGVNWDGICRDEVATTCGLECR